MISDITILNFVRSYIDAFQFLIPNTSALNLARSCVDGPKFVRPNINSPKLVKSCANVCAFVAPCINVCTLVGYYIDSLELVTSYINALKLTRSYVNGLKLTRGPIPTILNSWVLIPTTWDSVNPIQIIFKLFLCVQFKEYWKLQKILGSLKSKGSSDYDIGVIFTKSPLVRSCPTNIVLIQFLRDWNHLYQVRGS